MKRRQHRQLAKTNFLFCFLLLMMTSNKFFAGLDALPVVQRMEQKGFADCATKRIGEIFNIAPCKYCICESTNQKPKCYSKQCWSLNCVDPVQQAGECCPKCPNGANCEYKGILIKAKEKKFIENFLCSCPDFQVDLFETNQLQAICIPSYLNDYSHTESSEEEEEDKTGTI